MWSTAPHARFMAGTNFRRTLLCCPPGKSSSGLTADATRDEFAAAVRARAQRQSSVSIAEENPAPKQSRDLPRVPQILSTAPHLPCLHREPTAHFRLDRLAQGRNAGRGQAPLGPVNARLSTG